MKEINKFLNKLNRSSPFRVLGFQRFEKRQTIGTKDNDVSPKSEKNKQFDIPFITYIHL